MIQSLLQEPDTATAARQPMTCLLREDSDQLSLPMIYQRIVDGFAMKDMEAFIMSCVLESTAQTIIRALGLPIRASQRQQRTQKDVRLTPKQSALAFQYAQVLERSTLVFGTQTDAEEWLRRPCRSLDGNVPLIMVENMIGAQLVDEYLKRVESGVYQ
jgi:putative toxin-antitoxin system antitoxin component (TIGR02293 family)